MHFLEHLLSRPLLKTHNGPSRLVTHKGWLRQLGTAVFSLLTRCSPDIVISNFQAIFCRCQRFRRDLIRWPSFRKWWCRGQWFVRSIPCPLALTGRVPLNLDAVVFC